MNGKPRQRQIARFFSRIEKSETSCWLWTGSKLANGYGRLGRRPNLWLAHRFSYTIHKGAIPNGVFVCHSCDNPPCVNPDHLWLGTACQNMQDMSAKLRSNSDLAELDLIEVYRLAREGFAIRNIADLLGMNYAKASNIIVGKTFKFHFEKHHPLMFDMEI